MTLLWVSLTLLMIALVIRAGYDIKDPDAEVTNRPIRVKADQFVSSRACQSCHRYQHSTWHASYHRTMTQLATPQSVIGDFDDFVFKFRGTEVRLFTEEDRFFVGLKGAAEGVPTRFPVVLTTGSHHMQTYWFAVSEKSRALGQLGGVYLKDDQRWVPRSSAFLTYHQSVPLGELGRWNGGCLNCHATHGRLRPASFQNKFDFDVRMADTHVVEFGIACEACHGPGGEHVRANQNPWRRYVQHLNKTSDSTIVNPTRLSHKLSSQVCGHCHSVFHRHHVHAEEVKDWARRGSSFRPGQNLEEVAARYVVRGTLDRLPETERQTVAEDPEFLLSRFWSDGMVRVAGREYNGLIESPCYQRGELSCLSCHRMHQSREDSRSREQWANDQLGVEMDGNRACINCHHELAQPEKISAHTFHAENSAGSKCYNCHMPHTSYGLLKAIRSHQISSPSVQESLNTGRPNACNQCHLDKTLAWTADHLTQWYGIEKPELTVDQSEVAAAVLWLLRGDAGQRALAAWSFGWQDAQQASGLDWIAPYLGQLLQDPYDAVRYIAYRSLRRLPQYSEIQYNFIGSPAHRSQMRDEVMKLWNASGGVAQRNGADQLLLDENGQLDASRFNRLLKARDDRPISLVE